MKISVIGTGVIGTNHARILESMGYLHYVVDSDIKRGAQLQSLFPNKVTHSIPDSDAYIISTPSSTHFNVALSLLQQGKHVLIEKPVCTTVDDAVKLLPYNDLVTIAVGHCERHNSVVKYAHNWLRDNPVLIFNSYRLSSRPTRISDVGVITDLAVHDIDAQLYLIQSKPKSVWASKYTPGGFNHEHYGKITVEYENGAVGTSEVSWLNTHKVRKIDIVTESACATVDYLAQTFYKKEMQINSGSLVNGFNPEISSNEYTVELTRKEPLRVQMEDFIDSILNKRKPIVSLEDGIQALRIIEAAYQSIATSSKITL